MTEKSIGLVLISGFTGPLFVQELGRPPPIRRFLLVVCQLTSHRAATTPPFRPENTNFRITASVAYASQPQSHLQARACVPRRQSGAVGRAQDPARCYQVRRVPFAAREEGTASVCAGVSEEECPCVLIPVTRLEL